MTITTMYGQKRDDDQVADDKQRCIRAKEAFLQAMEYALLIHQSANAVDSLICSEEHFNDMLSPEWEKLCEEDGIYDDLPQSNQIKAWIAQQRKNTFRPQPTRSSAPTNPATYLANGEAL